MVNKNRFLIGLAGMAMLLVFGCGQNNSAAQSAGKDNGKTILPANPPNDSIAVIKAFNILKSDQHFLKDLNLEGEKQFNWNNDLHSIIWGDLNGDGNADALLSFIIESREGGNNSDGHYAVFLNQNHQWKYQSQLDAGGNWTERLIVFDEIKNGTINGNLVGIKNESLPEIRVEYMLKTKKIINTFTELHKSESHHREFLSVDHITTPDHIVIPIIATLKEYQHWLGKGNIIQPKEQPECGAHFDEGVYSELQYPNLNIELCDTEKAAIHSIILRGSGFRVETNKGTLTESITLTELTNILNTNNSWWINEEVNDGKLLIIPDGEQSDEQLHILFNKSEKLISIDFYVPC